MMFLTILCQNCNFKVILMPYDIYSTHVQNCIIRFIHLVVKKQCTGKPHFLISFSHLFNKFNNTWALMLDLLYPACVILHLFHFLYIFSKCNKFNNNIVSQAFYHWYTGLKRYFGKQWRHKWNATNIIWACTVCYDKLNLQGLEYIFIRSFLPVTP